MEKDTIELKKEYKASKGWGLLSTIDFHSCNPNLIRDESKIKEFVKELCDKIKMRRFGEPVIVRFGKDKTEGITAIQLIETSSIVAHFVDHTNNLFLDIFSCKFYNPNEVAEFIKQFFKAKNYKLNYQIRK